MGIITWNMKPVLQASRVSIPGRSVSKGALLELSRYMANSVLRECFLPAALFDSLHACVFSSIQAILYFEGFSASD